MRDLDTSVDKGATPRSPTVQPAAAGRRVTRARRVLALQRPAHGLDIDSKPPGDLLLGDVLDKMHVAYLGPLGHSDHLWVLPVWRLETGFHVPSR